MKNVFVVSHFFPQEDWQDVIGKEKIRLKAGTFTDFLQEYAQNKVDLLIFAREGAVIHNSFAQNKNNPVFQRFLHDNTIRKTVWTMDSHHQWQLEIQLQQFFERLHYFVWVEKPSAN